jgi:hypothetical protein
MTCIIPGVGGAGIAGVGIGVDNGGGGLANGSEVAGEG